MRLIDADVLTERLKNAIECGRRVDMPTLELEAVLVDVQNAPSIDIEPKRGEWIDMGDFEQCSVCKGTHLKEFQSYYGKTTWIKTPYCPNCGADMRKGADDE